MFGKRHGARASAAGAMAINSTDRRWGLWLGLVVVLLCSTYASHLRLAQLAHWEREPQQYVASGIPMMTTLDAYYSLRIARLYAAGQFVPHAPVPARHYSRPEQADPNDWYDQREPKTLPLLSGVIAVASPLFGGDIDKTALRLPALLSSLFMIPLFLCCWRLGAPAAGVLGGLTATFCIEYWQRTSLGWVDTDSLNLFFPWTVSWLILTMGAEQRRATLLFLSGTEPIQLQIALEKGSKSKTDKGGKAGPVGRFVPGKKVAGPASAAPAAPDCSYPFYVDESGIKRIRKECM